MRHNGSTTTIMFGSCADFERADQQEWQILGSCDEPNDERLWPFGDHPPFQLIVWLRTLER
jgi:hypothetical protein